MTGGTSGAGGTGSGSTGGSDLDSGSDSSSQGCRLGCIMPLVCISGRCGCPNNQTWCSPECVDTETSRSHCGECQHGCAQGELCSAGTCIGPVATDGCTDDLARDLTLQEIAVYQSVKIPVMIAGNEVEPALRNAKVIRGRETMLRAFVTVGTEWTPREIAARLTLRPQDGGALVFSSRKLIETTSTDAELSNTFQFFVPAETVATSLRYSLELVECASRAGDTGRARFPETGDVDLGVEYAGGLKVTIVPIQVGDYRPDTSAAGLAAYLGQMMAMYPIEDITFTVGDTLTATSPVDWEGMLQDVRNQRALDAPSADVYYFGLVKPAATLRTYCLTSCTTGIGYVVTNNYSSAAPRRVAVGIGYGDKNSAETMAHELGHNHGREHAPCVTAGSIASPDPDFPYDNGGIGIWGYDQRTRSLIDPSKAADIMGYCNNQWISDYTYNALTDRVRLLNGALMAHMPAAPRGRWWIMDIDSKGVHWGIALGEETFAEGDPEPATIYGNRGQALTSVTVYRTKMSNGRGSMLMVPAPEAGWDAIAVRGAPPLSFAAPMRAAPKRE